MERLSGRREGERGAPTPGREEPAGRRPEPSPPALGASSPALLRVFCPKVQRVPRARRQEGAAAPGRAARRSGRSCFCRGGEREPRAGARSAALTPRPAAPPARPPGAPQADALNASRCGGGARGRAHGAGRTEPGARRRLGPGLGPHSPRRPRLGPHAAQTHPSRPAPAPTAAGEASGAQCQEGLRSAHLECLQLGPPSKTAGRAVPPRLGLIDP